jgi:hypothetical protein
MATKELVWFPVEVESMSATLRKQYAELQAAQDKVKKLKADFEDSFVVAARKADRIDSNLSLAFGYKFGKLSIAKVDKQAAKASSSKPKFSF